MYGKRYCGSGNAKGVGNGNMLAVMIMVAVMVPVVVLVAVMVPVVVLVAVMVNVLVTVYGSGDGNG